MIRTSIPQGFGEKHPVRTPLRISPSILLSFLLLALGAFRAAASVLPTGFVESRLATGLDPTSLEIAPDGRLFVTEKNGRIRIIKNGVMLTTPFLTLSVDNFNERGLQNIILDPDFASNGYVYVLYMPAGSNQNRVSRFKASGDVAVADSEFVLLYLGTSQGSIHNGGGMYFLDGKLFITTGDGGNYNLPQSNNSLLGKILRINPDGTIPTDNPFYNSATGVNRAIWARGMRNPFKASVQRGTNRVFINDVGTATWEEVNEPVAGKNYGYPMLEGFRTAGQYAPGNYQDPFFAYSHSEGCSITGGAFYNPVNAQFPAGYVGKYFYADYCAGYIRTVDLATKAKGNFATGVNRPVDIKVGPDGSMYYLVRGSTNSNTSTTNGEVWRITYTASQSPFISAHPTSQTTSVGGSVTFNVSASGSAPLTYQWQRNGVNISGATSSSYTLSNIGLSSSGATFRAVVTNNFGSATSNSATLTVLDNSAPTATITTPLAGTKYNAGQTISFAGTGSDPEDGTLPASAFTWWVDFFHDDTGLHTHPVIPPTSGITSSSFEVPLSVHGFNVWYRIYLRVTDSDGQATTTFREVYPNRSTYTITSNPTGLQLYLDGESIFTPYSYTTTVGAVQTVEARSPQDRNGTSYQFSNWSDGGAATHTIKIPATNATLTANYTASGPIGLRTPENPADAVGGLNYQYYQGIWNNLPAFSTLTPRATGTVTSFSLTPKLRADFYGFRYTGFVDVPTDGTYTFYTRSDDGSQLLIGNTLVVNNDGLHGPEERSGTIGLKAGKHAVTVTYFDHAGEGDLLSVSYAGPGLSKRTIPAAALFRTTGTAPPSFTATLEAENAVRSGAVVSTQHAGYTGTGFVDYINLTGDYIEWTANVPTAGAYALSFRYALQSAQARQLAVRVNGTVVNSGLTFPPTISLTSWTYVSLTANLQAGANTIRATATGTSGPNIDHLRVSSASGARLAGTPEDLADAVQLYPVPVDQVLTVVTPDAATAQLRLTGAQGLALQPTILERGASHILLDVSSLKNGFYLLTVQTPRGQVTKRVVIGR
jgi:glucose/arabinose dehydrogenase